jgi:CRP-like cAMP-binding protein
MKDIFDDKIYRVITATDGIEANMKFQNEEFDIVVTDIRMPKMDGLTFVRTIQKIKIIPVLFITGSSYQYKTELELFEKVEILKKPFTSIDMISAVSRMLNKKTVKSATPKVLDFKAGEIVLREGTCGDELFLVKDGTLRVMKTLETGDRLEITKIGTGEIIGEMSMLLNAKRTATVEAATDVSLMEIPKEKFYEVLNSQPKWFKILFQTISRRLEETTALLARERKK